VSSILTTPILSGISMVEKQTVNLWSLGSSPSPTATCLGGGIW
jgi:hypothetical protein